MWAIHLLTCVSIDRIAGGNNPLMPSLSLSLLLNAIPLFHRESWRISMPNCFVLSGFGYFTPDKCLHMWTLCLQARAFPREEVTSFVVASIPEKLKRQVQVRNTSSLLGKISRKTLDANCPLQLLQSNEDKEAVSERVCGYA